MHRLTSSQEGRKKGREVYRLRIGSEERKWGENLETRGKREGRDCDTFGRKREGEA